MDAAMACQGGVSRLTHARLEQQFCKRIAFRAALAREEEDGRVISHAAPISIRTKSGKLRLVKRMNLH